MIIPKHLNPVFASAATAPALSLDEARERLIVALDVPDSAKALKLADQLRDKIKWFKIGLELFVNEGHIVTKELSRRGHSIFLDLKFHDIPNTVAGAVRSAAELGVQMMTVHAGGGPAMLAAAQEALNKMKNRPQLLAVTVLTSMDADQMSAIGLERQLGEQVELLAAMGQKVGVNGFVCSAQEVASLRALTGPESVLVVPGIRPIGSNAGDQKRIATSAEALRLGASFLVVGRPITQEADPAKAAEEILHEMAVALAG